MKTQKHPLLIYELISKRLRGKLLLLGVVMAVIGLVDQFNPILGDAWVYWWVAVALVFALWVYYAFLVRRAGIQVRDKVLRLQGPVLGNNISYGRIYAITSAQMAQHYAFEDLKGREQSLLEPLYNRTCVFIELTSWPPKMKRRHLWYPKFIFGTSRPGLICVVEDWLGLSHDLEGSRGGRQTRRKKEVQDDTRSLARQILDLDDDDY